MLQMWVNSDLFTSRDVSWTKEKTKLLNCCKMSSKEPLLFKSKLSK